jgi:transcriptional regulator with XRE-family HTH domain
MSGVDIDRLVVGLGTQLGGQVRDERRRRRWTIRDLAGRAGVSPSLVQWLETGHPASLETYARVAGALSLRPDFRLIDPRHREAAPRQADIVHAAIGEVLATRLVNFRHPVALDEPFQHYQFAGRADVLSWSVEDRAMLHVENRTRFPNLQEAFGSYNAKRRYLPAVIADRYGIRGGWRSVTHVIAALWSSEVLHSVRIHRSSFAAVCPDAPDAFEAWLSGVPPPDGDTSTIVLIDPVHKPRHRLYVPGDALDAIRPRYPSYADAARALSALAR